MGRIAPVFQLAKSRVGGTVDCTRMRFEEEMPIANQERTLCYL